VRTHAAHCLNSKAHKFIYGIGLLRVLLRNTAAKVISALEGVTVKATAAAARPDLAPIWPARRSNGAIEQPDARDEVEALATLSRTTREAVRSCARAYARELPISRMNQK
jgi:hypothetical protein